MSAMFNLVGWGVVLALVVLYADAVEIIRCRVYEEKSMAAVASQRKVLFKGALLAALIAAYLALAI